MMRECKLCYNEVMNILLVMKFNEIVKSLLFFRWMFYFLIFQFHIIWSVHHIPVECRADIDDIVVLFSTHLSDFYFPNDQQIRLSLVHCTNSYKKAILCDQLIMTA